MASNRNIRREKNPMKAKFITACLVAAALAGSSAVASAQGGSTDRNGNAMGSEHVGNGARHMGAKHMGSRHMSARHMKGTVGMSGHTARDNPNGAPGAMPKAKAGPQGDSSKDNDAPK